MSNMPAVSVLMSVYNTPLNYLEEAINSILTQSFSDFEIVLINDGSTDAEVLGYIEKLDREEERVHLYNNDKNIGITKSLNVGLLLCKGKYIARMDTDDIAPTYRLFKEKEYLDEHPEIALVGGRILVFEDSSELTEDFIKGQGVKRRTEDPELHAIRSLLEHSGPAHPSFMYRRDFLFDNEIHYRENIKYAQDYGLMADIYMTGGSISIMPEVMLYYREHPGQISSTKLKEQIGFQEEISREYLKKVCPMLTKEESEALAKIREDVYYYPPGCYLKAIKKVMAENDKTNRFNGEKLKAEFRYEWLRHVIRCLKKNSHPLWIFHPFSILAFKDYKRIKREIVKG